MPPTRNLFKEFPNRVYVETGAWLGDSIQLALDAGFQEIHSIEIDPEKVEHCRQRFAGQPVTIHQGDSALILYDVIKDINEPITFWLDSHSQLLEDEPESENPWPLFKELQAIDNHPLNTHAILIDDFLFMTHPDITGWSKNAVEGWVKCINRRYDIEYFANPIKNNIMAASIK